MPTTKSARKVRKQPAAVASRHRAAKVQTIAAPAPAEKDYTPKKAVEKQLARRKIILDCIRISITSNDEILANLHARGFAVSQRTMIDDKMAVMSSIKDYYGRDAKELTAEIVAQQDGVIYQLQQIASDKGAERGEKISALAKKNDVLNGKAKLLGLITDRQEVRGSVTNLNINDPTADEIAEFNRAARDAGDDGSMILEALEA